VGHAAEAEMDALEDLQSLRREIRQIRRHSQLRLHRLGREIGRAKALLRSMDGSKLTKPNTHEWARR
jgi:hypothetical protein